MAPATAWTTLALLLLLGMVASLDRQVIALPVAPIEADLHIGDTQISPLQGFAFTLLYTSRGFCNFIAVAAAAVQVVTRSPLRGKTAALYLMLISLFGLIVGPSLTALIADHVIDEQRIGVAMSCVFGLLAPIAGIFFLLGLKPMRDAVGRAA